MICSPDWARAAEESLGAVLPVASISVQYNTQILKRAETLDRSESDLGTKRKRGRLYPAYRLTVACCASSLSELMLRCVAISGVIIAGNLESRPVGEAMNSPCC
jgi:hypothetical protein